MLKTLRNGYKYILLGLLMTILVGGIIVVHVLKSHHNSQISPDIHKIKHIVVIMQENRSFDHYFGTFPGADGIPMQNGVPAVCNPDPNSGKCIKPYHDTNDKNVGGPHSETNATAAINGGKMDGFVAQSIGHNKGCGNAPDCASDAPSDVMGYHTDQEIPNYWSYAKNFVLQDKMFEPNASWSLPQHLFQVSEWSAKCSAAGDPSSCVNALQSPGSPLDQPNNKSKKPPDYAWTDLTYLLHKQNIPWAYYVFSGTEPDCQDASATACKPVAQHAKTPGIWNPLPNFDTVKQDNQLGNIQSLTNFYAAAKDGTLPAVSWIDPTGQVSEHPTALVSTGQAYVTGLVNSIMQGPDWNSTAIFLSWDDWGGFYECPD